MLPVEHEAAPQPPTPRNTLRCQAPGCGTPLVEIVRHERRVTLRFLVPNERDEDLSQTRVPCPTCGAVRVVTHR